MSALGTDLLNRALSGGRERLRDVLREEGLLEDMPRRRRDLVDDPRVDRCPAVVTSTGAGPCVRARAT